MHIGEYFELAYVQVDGFIDLVSLNNAVTNDVKTVQAHA